VVTGFQEGFFSHPESTQMVARAKQRDRPILGPGLLVGGEFPNFIVYIIAIYYDLQILFIKYYIS
jgi:hypothetical protein